MPMMRLEMPSIGLALLTDRASQARATRYTLDCLPPHTRTRSSTRVYGITVTLIHSR